MSTKRTKKRTEESVEIPKLKACDRCKAVHKKCDGDNPCKRCVEMSATCVYSFRVEENVFESLSKKDERLRSEDARVIETRKQLEAAAESKKQKLSEIQSTIQLVQTRAAKFYKIAKLKVYIDWYSATIGKGCGIQIPYSDVGLFLSDRNPIRSALMTSIVGCGALIVGDIAQANLCITEASNFAMNYKLGDEKFFCFEANLFFNIGIFGFSSGNWSRSASALQKLTTLEQKFSSKLESIDSYLNTLQQNQQVVVLPSDKETLDIYQFNNILTLAGEVLQLQLAQNPLEMVKTRQPRHVPLNSVQELRAKIRMSAYKIFTYLQSGTILVAEEINKLFVDLLQEASELDSIQRDLLTHLTMAVSVFAYHASHQTTKAIQACRDMLPLTEKLISQMKCYVYPYANVFSILPFLHIYQQNDLIERVEEIFLATKSALGQLCLQQHQAFMNRKPLQPFFQRTVGGWGHLSLPVIQFGSSTPRALPQTVQQTSSPMRTNEELQRLSVGNNAQPAQEPQHQPQAMYQRTGHKRQRIDNPSFKVDLNTPPSQTLPAQKQSMNYVEQASYADGHTPPHEDQRPYVIARPQEYYPQQQEYVQEHHGHHYVQPYNGQEYAQQVPYNTKNNYSQDYSQAQQPEYDNTGNVFISQTPSEYQTHPQSHPQQNVSWLRTGVAKTSNHNNVQNYVLEQDQTHQYYVNTLPQKHSGKHEDSNM